MEGWSKPELLAELDVYQRELQREGIDERIASLHVEHARMFVAWLERRVGAASTVSMNPPRRASIDGPSGPGLPPKLRELISVFVAAGKPEQEGFAWPRGRWIAAFPEHASMLHGLPPRLDRDALRSACERASQDRESAEQAFLAVMAWGFGNVGYGPFRTRRVLTDTPNARRRLWTVAGTLAARGPIAAYRQLADPRDARLRWLGPAFGTKFLYFCQPAGIHQQALILDETVATWLHRELGLDLQPTRWSVSSYSSYLDLFGRWAAELECAPEDIEYCIFQAMADERGTQWAR